MNPVTANHCLHISDTVSVMDASQSYFPALLKQMHTQFLCKLWSDLSWLLPIPVPISILEAERPHCSKEEANREVWRYVSELQSGGGVQVRQTLEWWSPIYLLNATEHSLGHTESMSLSHWWSKVNRGLLSSFRNSRLEWARQERTQEWHGLFRYKKAYVRRSSRTHFH